MTRRSPPLVLWNTTPPFSDTNPQPRPKPKSEGNKRISKEVVPVTRSTSHNMSTEKTVDGSPNGRRNRGLQGVGGHRRVGNGGYRGRDFNKVYWTSTATTRTEDVPTGEGKRSLGDQDKPLETVHDREGVRTLPSEILSYLSPHR